ncbi:MAG: M23 family metallopeptidase, partial [Bacteroidia bacterium]|nr:M23 family metallopeptidase [Bacteroidia bacterium]
MANSRGLQLFLHKYRLLWIEDSGSWRRELRLPVWGWLLLLMAILVGIWSVFAYTPLRYTIPGYPTRAFREKYTELIQRARQLEQKMTQYTLMIEELRTLSQVMREETGTSLGIPLLSTVHSGEYILPLEGNVSRRIQPAKGHWGIDITSPAGAPVLAIAEGTVVLAEYSYESGY